MPSRCRPFFGGRLDAAAEAAAAAGPLVAGPQIYQSIGVEPVINCRGTFTIIGGSVERPEVRAAMDAASRYFVQIDELADAVGRAFRRADRGRVGHGLGRMRGRDEARHGRLRHRRQSGKARFASRISPVSTRPRSSSRDRRETSTTMRFATSASEW